MVFKILFEGICHATTPCIYLRRDMKENFHLCRHLFLKSSNFYLSRYSGQQKFSKTFWFAIYARNKNIIIVYNFIKLNRHRVITRNRRKLLSQTLIKVDVYLWNYYQTRRAFSQRLNLINEQPIHNFVRSKT